MPIRPSPGMLAVTTIAVGACAVTAAGPAAAQLPGQPANMTFTSSSSVSVSRSSGDIVVSYSNGSGRDLYCGVIVSTDEVIRGLYGHYRTADLVVGQPEPPLPATVQESVEAAQNAGEYAVGNFEIVRGASGRVVHAESGPITWDEGNPLEQPTSQSFDPEAVAICGGDPVETETGVWATYGEVETTVAEGGTGPGGDHPGLGDWFLDLLSAIGS